jgi:predicted ester cyclase
MATPQDALSAAHASWNAGDLEGYLKLYDESIKLHGYSAEPMGKEQVRGFYQGMFAAFGDPPPLDFHEVLWHGADTATIRFTMRGTHQGEFMGVPATGTAVAASGITILRFSGDKVVERWSSADLLGLLIQVGGIPAPA